MKKTMRKVTGAALGALLAVALLGSASGMAGTTARGHTEGVTWETGTVARGPQNQNTQGVTWEAGVTWE